MSIRTSLLNMVLGIALMPVAAWAQCSTGVDTGGGNCLPPEQLGLTAGGAQQDAAPLPSWESRWGAVVSDQATGNTGVAEGQRSKDDAVDSAMKDCKSDGSRNCRVVESFRNTCVAVAAARRYSGSAVNTDLGKARAKAMNECSKGGTSCTIIYSACSYPVRTQ
ncbi:DUF4189 domain-containing protein [Bacillus sp. NP157]|nr:DUF4189 domain-containing protein [Bacillus sp. NP157]